MGATLSDLSEIKRKINLFNGPNLVVQRATRETFFYFPFIQMKALAVLVKSGEWKPFSEKAAEIINKQNELQKCERMILLYLQ